MKSTWFSNKRRYEFGKLLQAADYGSHVWETFGGFLTCASYSLRQAVHKFQTGEMNAEFEEIVLKEQGRFKDWTKFAEAMGVLTLALEDEPHDFLGSFLSEMEMNDAKFRGQCFTPPSVCRMMAEMTVGQMTPKDGETLMLNEPASGGGAMVIHTSEILWRQGFYPWHYFWMTVDVDWRCFAMTYIQLTLLGIPAVVVHGNSLSLETFSEAVTFVGAMHPPKRKREQVEEVQTEEVEVATLPAQPVVPSERQTMQLTLF